MRERQTLYIHIERDKHYTYTVRETNIIENTAHKNIIHVSVLGKQTLTFGLFLLRSAGGCLYLCLELFVVLADRIE